jgi:hypothetical protein
VSRRLDTRTPHSTTVSFNRYKRVRSACSAPAEERITCLTRKLALS